MAELLIGAAAPHTELASNSRQGEDGHGRVAAVAVRSRPQPQRTTAGRVGVHLSEPLQLSGRDAGDLGGALECPSQRALAQLVRSRACAARKA